MILARLAVALSLAMLLWNHAAAVAALPWLPNFSAEDLEANLEILTSSNLGLGSSHLITIINNTQHRLPAMRTHQSLNVQFFVLASCVYILWIGVLALHVLRTTSN